MAGETVMNSVIGKLTTLLVDEYKHIKGVNCGTSFLRDELSSMNTVLQKLTHMEDDQIDVQTKEWRNKVRELSYDIEDCIDRFMHRLSRGDAKPNFVRKVVRKMKMLWEDHLLANEIRELKARVVDESQRRDRYNIGQCITVPDPVPLDPRAPTLYEEARNLVGIDKPRDQIIGWIKGEETQLKVVSIFGIGGLGKTTLAMEVYHKIDESFDCRALVSVSRTPDIKKLLRDMLFQINKCEYDMSEKWEMEQLIPTLRNNLKDKRYFIVIDDIWSISAWEHLKSALPINENRSRVITTTRNKDVAKSCCTGFGEHMYEAKPLSEEHSHSLFFRRVFGSSKDCPQELTEVANGILKKCGGLPLAIISMASLLANKSATVDVWVKIRNSISSAVEKDSSVDKMKRILFISYFDLPHYLKTCLLYLSVFPEDYSIDSRYLIRTWISEGLVPGRNRESMEQLGESYLNELINRSMIQPTKIGVDGKTVKSCKVHDIVLDFIISQAVEDNFVNILNGNDFCENPSNKIRRLSFQAAKFSKVSQLPKSMKDVSHLRSVHMFGSDHPEQWMTRFLSSQVLRVLNIENSRSLENSHLEHIGSFCLLKYLRIVDTGISKLPEQIGKLQHLEILDLRGERQEVLFSELPTSIVQLQKLVCLFIDPKVALPDGIGRLHALEELAVIDIDKASIKAIQGLGDLAKLRALRILPRGDDEGREKAWTSSLSKLVVRSLRSLDFMKFSSCRDYSWMSSCDSPPPLRRLVCTIDTIPSEIGSLVNLTRLRLEYVREVGEEGLKILASLPMLLSLTLRLMLNDDVLHQRQVIGSHGFQRLVKFTFRSADGAGLMFGPGAMPKLQRLKLRLMARCQLKYGGLVIGLQHLSGLKHITVRIDCNDAVADEVKALEGDIRGAAGIHPNCPILEIQTTCIGIKVDLGCNRSYAWIQMVLRKIQVKYNIEGFSFDFKTNKVTVSGLFDPHALSRVLYCEAGHVIKDCTIPEK